MSQRWRNKNDVGFSIGGEGDNGVMLYVEAFKSLGNKWKVTFHQTSDLTPIDGEYASSQEAMIAALKVVVRDLEETLSKARKELKRAQREEANAANSLRETLDRWGDAIRAFPIDKSGGK